MGNRAVITSETYIIRWDEDENGKPVPVYESNSFIDKSHRPGIYLHWNGGYDSVHGFLEYCKLHGFRTGNYGMARLVQVIANFFGGDGLSVGIDECRRLDCDNYDNGVYLVKDWEIVGRRFHEGSEQNEYDLHEVMEYINDCQPEKMKLPKEVIWSESVKAEELNVGDEFWYQHWSGEYRKETVKETEQSAIDRKWVNGTPTDRLVYFGDSPTNINHYVRKDTIVRVPIKKED